MHIGCIELHVVCYAVQNTRKRSPYEHIYLHMEMLTSVDIYIAFVLCVSGDERVHM